MAGYDINLTVLMKIVSQGVQLFFLVFDSRFKMCSKRHQGVSQTGRSSCLHEGLFLPWTRHRQQTSLLVLFPPSVPFNHSVVLVDVTSFVSRRIVMHYVVRRIVPWLPLARGEYEIERRAKQVNSGRYQEHNLKEVVN